MVCARLAITYPHSGVEWLGYGWFPKVSHRKLFNCSEAAESFQNLFALLRGYKIQPHGILGLILASDRAESLRLKRCRKRWAGVF